MKSLILVHKKPAREAALEMRIQYLEQALKASEAEKQRLTLKYGAEIRFNSELIDLCRAYRIPFRPVLEHAFRTKHQ